MDVNGIANLSTTLATTATNQAVDMTVLKKANHVQASTAAALVAALPPVTKPNMPDHLGQNIDTSA
jgi:putative motility protein YjfB-like